MQRLKLTIAYDGTLFSGYQVQPKKRTVQEEIESALKKMHKGSQIKIFASGRTDAGVHAKGQVIHFDTNLMIPLEKWAVALNTLLPADITINKVESVSSEFHARFDAFKKEYRYFIYPSKVRDPFKRNYSYIYSNQLNHELVTEAMKSFIGTHDFTSFCSAKTEVEDKIRTIYTAEILEENDMLVFRFVGNGFLYNMVRIMTGTLLEVGTGQRSINSIEEALLRKERSFGGKTAPPQGLYLWDVSY